MRTRFSGWSSGPRATVLALLAVAMLGMAILATRPSSGPTLRTAEVGQTDAALYRAIVARVRAGDGYYTAAAASLREGHYPLRPFITFRLPTLTWLQVTLGDRAIHLVQSVLGIAVFMAWGLRLWPELPRPILAFALLLLWVGIIGVIEPTSGLFGESWSAMLIALAIALDRPKWFPAAILSGLAAMLFRELAALAIVGIASIALITGRRREALAWLAAIAVFGVVVVLHAYQVAAVVRPEDLVSPGWAGMMGPSYFLRALATVTPLGMLPGALASGLLVLSWFGWWSIPADWALPPALVIGGYGMLIALFARADTFYWAMMAAPLSLVGLAFVPAALRDLVRPAPKALA